MEIQKDFLFKFWIKNKAEEYAIIILQCLWDLKEPVDNYESFLIWFDTDHLFTLDKIGKYLFYKYWEEFIYQLYLYYLWMPDAQYYRTEQNLQTTEETRISSEEKGRTDSKKD